MPTTPLQNPLVLSVGPSLCFFVTALTAVAILRRGWYRILPMLSTYVLALAVTGIPLMILYALTICSSPVRYAACRIYTVGYEAYGIMGCYLSLAVLYEFLFSMAGTNKTIRRTAVAGFVITASLTTLAAYALMNQYPLSHNRLMNAFRFLSEVTALTLLSSGIFVFAVKKIHSLYLEPRLTRVLAALTLYNFITVLSSFTLRESSQAGLIVSQIIGLAFVILLYAAVKNASVPAVQR